MWKMLISMGVVFGIINLALGSASYVIIAFFAIGVAAFIFTEYGSRKLKRLKRDGQAVLPDKTTFVPVYRMGTGGFKAREVYRAFKVECRFNDLSGNPRTETSQTLATHRSSMSVEIHTTPLFCRATVYINPNNPKDFAIDVEVD
jgi:hypothetical protein